MSLAKAAARLQKGVVSRSRTLIATLLFAASCAPVEDRTEVIASTLLRADDALFHSRPRLLADKYAAMAADPFTFYRGSIALFARDVRAGEAWVGESAFATDAPLVAAIGDPHPENFGLLEGRDGALRLEVNDFDAADRLPLVWDLRRWACGIAVANHVASLDETSEANAVRSGVRVYLNELRALAAGGERRDFTVDQVEPGAAGAAVRDVFTRGTKRIGHAQELDDLTTGEGTARRFRRGMLDAADPTKTLEDVPAELAASVPGALETWRRSLRSPSDADGTLIDVVREFGAGVASLPKIRLLVLLQTPRAARVLELKELGDAGLGRWTSAPVTAASVATRVDTARLLAWPTIDADPLWGSTSWIGLPIQVRAERASHVSVRVHRLESDRGTPAAVEGLASAEATVLARAHAGDAGRVVAFVRERDETLQTELATFARACRVRVVDDHARFTSALTSLGPWLGARRASADAATGPLGFWVDRKDPP